MSIVKGQKLALIQLIKVEGQNVHKSKICPNMSFWSKDKMSFVKRHNVLWSKDIMSFAKRHYVLCPKDIMSFVQKTLCPFCKRTKGRNLFFFRRRASRQGQNGSLFLGSHFVFFLSQICPFFFPV